MSLYPPGQCTDGAATWAPWVTRYGNLGNAKDWPHNWAQHGGAEGSTPHVGDLACFQPGVDGAGGFGHVGLVVGVSGSTFTLREENGPAGLGRTDNRVCAAVAGVVFLSSGSQPAPAPPPPPPHVAAGDVIVQSGDTMSSIAARHGITLAALEAANKQVANFNLIHVGQILHLPGGAATPPPVQHWRFVWVNGAQASALGRAHLFYKDHAGNYQPFGPAAGTGALYQRLPA